MFKLSAVAALRIVFCAAVARIRAVLGPACGRLPFLGAIAGVDDDAVSGSMPVKDVHLRKWRLAETDKEQHKSRSRTCGCGKLDISSSLEKDWYLS